MEAKVIFIFFLLATEKRTRSSGASLFVPHQWTVAQFGFKEYTHLRHSYMFLSMDVGLCSNYRRKQSCGKCRFRMCVCLFKGGGYF